MPHVRITTTESLNDDRKLPLLTSVSQTVSRITGKREALIMVFVDDACGILGGSPDPAAFVDVRAIGGLHDDVNEALSAALSELISEHADIPPDRIFLNFTNLRGYHWGWNGKTFRR